MCFGGPLLARSFSCQVAADEASADGAEDCVMVRVMTHDRADNRALDAALGFGLAAEGHG
jgi:hypothetical protein